MTVRGLCRVAPVWLVVQAAAVAVVAFDVSPAGAHSRAGAVDVSGGSAAVSVVEGATEVATLTNAGVHPLALGAATWLVAGGADAGDFTLSARGVLAFGEAKDFEDPSDADGDGVYEVTVAFIDGPRGATADVAVTVLNAIELTAIEGPSAVSVAENHYGRVAAFSASSHTDAAAIHWSLAGFDEDHFTIDAPAGVLRLRTPADGPGGWRAAADFEDPADADGDGVYDVVVVASAPGGASTARPVAVTVTDVDEPGAIAWSDTRPRAGEALTATLADPDTVVGPVQWVWERTAGRNNWAIVARLDSDGASSSYIPTAADSGEHLRATAHYRDTHSTRDAHDAANTVSAALHHVVLADLLSALSVSAVDAAPGGDDAPWRLQRPAFDPRTLHYSVGCADDDAMALTFAAAGAASRLAVDGVAYPNPGAGEPVTATVPVTGASDVTVSVTNAAGGETRYVIHCLHERMEQFTVETHPGATDQLLLVAREFDLLILDANGVPRWRHELTDARARNYFRFYPDGPDGEFRYSYSLRGGRHVVLDEDLQPLAEVTTVAPLTHTAIHDFRVLPDGNYLLIAFEDAVRDYSRLTFFDAEGFPFGTETQSTDSAIQLVTPEGEALLTWNAWDHLPLEDCTHHWFPPLNARWAHVNSVGVYNGEFVASFRGCNTVLGIDPATGAINWRVGPTNAAEPGFTSPAPDPAPLAIVGDPEGQFCAQHAASVTPEGRLLLYDNGANCSRNPWTAENLVRPDRTYSRAVEYQLDPGNGEAVYIRERSLGGTRDRIGWYGGHVETLENGDWLISWGSEFFGAQPQPPRPVNELATATQLDPATGAERLTLLWGFPPERDSRVTAMPASALARQPEPVAATIHHAGGSHAGPGDRLQVVVTFNRPVAAFDAGSPSLSVRGATVTAVEPRIAAGEPANSYTVTLAPRGRGPITFALLADQPCDTGGVCAADGTTLTDVPPAVSIAARDGRR